MSNIDMRKQLVKPSLEKIHSADPPCVGTAWPFCAEAQQSGLMTGKLFINTGESWPALKKTSRTFKYKGQWAVRMRPMTPAHRLGAFSLCMMRF